MLSHFQSCYMFGHSAASSVLHMNRTTTSMLKMIQKLQMHTSPSCCMLLHCLSRLKKLESVSLARNITHIKNSNQYLSMYQNLRFYSSDGKSGDYTDNEGNIRVLPRRLLKRLQKLGITCKHSQTFVNTLKHLQTLQNLLKHLQTLVNTCKHLQIHTNTYK